MEQGGLGGSVEYLLGFDHRASVSFALEALRCGVGVREGNMTERVRRYASLTKNVRLFSACYWGNFEVPHAQEQRAEAEAIAVNRDGFAEEFGLVKYVSNDRPISNLGLFDHCELYKCRVGYVYIVSPYSELADLAAEAELTNLAAEAGMKRYADLYSHKAKTYLRQFSDKREFNRFKKQFAR